MVQARRRPHADHNVDPGVLPPRQRSRTRADAQGFAVRPGDILRQARSAVREAEREDSGDYGEELEDAEEQKHNEEVAEYGDENGKSSSNEYSDSPARERELHPQ